MPHGDSCVGNTNGLNTIEIDPELNEEYEREHQLGKIVIDTVDLTNSTCNSNIRWSLVSIMSLDHLWTLKDWISKN
ncbi:hypothetical protein GOP47_0023885 [Adiantum capillus-veneris]|uniref:Uncharacterized protein n=1 Tax=Adiantum capillus-veneris TaxID=13818 RepID=A0A9D4U5D1_ADICA|nr:hypothetical protein GOP47_0023885 [Adiantum capillus-veneris]